MADLNTRLHTIIETCAPVRNNDCLHQQLQRLSVKDMSTVMANYVDYAMHGGATRNLPVVNLDDMIAGMSTLGQPNAPGNPDMYNFHERY